MALHPGKGQLPAGNCVSGSLQPENGGRGFSAARNTTRRQEFLLADSRLKGVGFYRAHPQLPDPIQSSDT